MRVYYTSNNRDVILQKVGSSYAQFRTPIHADNSTKEDKALNFYRARKSSHSPSEIGKTSIENNEIFGNLLPTTMSVYTPFEFKIQKGEGDLNNRLPNINKKRGGQFLPFEYRPHAKYFGSDNHETAMSKRSGSQNRGGIPKPKKTANNGHKTARVGSPSGFPYLKSTPRHHLSKRRSSNASIIFKRQDLNITNDDELERAYKNFLPGEIEMLKDDIEFKNISRSSTNRRYNSKNRHQTSKKRNNHSKVLQEIERLNISRSLSSNRRSIEPSEYEQRLTPMERRDIWRKANKKLKKKKQKQKSKSKLKQNKEGDYEDNSNIDF